MPARAGVETVIQTYFYAAGRAIPIAIALAVVFLNVGSTRSGEGAVVPFLVLQIGGTAVRLISSQSRSTVIIAVRSAAAKVRRADEIDPLRIIPIASRGSATGLRPSPSTLIPEPHRLDRWPDAWMIPATARLLALAICASPTGRRNLGPFMPLVRTVGSGTSSATAAVVEGIPPTIRLGAGWAAE